MRVPAPTKAAPESVVGALFVALVTVCRCRRQAAGGKNPLARWAAMASQRALEGHYFLLERCGEVAQLAGVAGGSVVAAR